MGGGASAEVQEGSSPSPGPPGPVSPGRILGERHTEGQGEREGERQRARLKERDRERERERETERGRAGGRDREAGTAREGGLPTSDPADGGHMAAASQIKRLRLGGSAITAV